jgi:hypothetical protein
MPTLDYTQNANVPLPSGKHSADWAYVTRGALRVQWVLRSNQEPIRERFHKSAALPQITSHLNVT